MKQIQNWIDDWVYRLCYRSINRWLRRNPGFLYLFELRLRRWREQNPDKFPDAMLRSAESFNEELDKHIERSALKKADRTTIETLRLVRMHR